MNFLAQLNLTLLTRLFFAQVFLIEPIFDMQYIPKFFFKPSIFVTSGFECFERKTCVKI